MSITETVLGLLTANIQSVLIFLILFLVLWHYYSLPSNLPPGPPNLPLVGSIPFLRLPLHSRFTDWKKKYGDVVSMYLGGQLVVVLNSYEVIKEAFITKGDVSSGRIQFDLLKLNGDDKAGTDFFSLNIELPQTYIYIYIYMYIYIYIYIYFN